MNYNKHAVITIMYHTYRLDKNVECKVYTVTTVDEKTLEKIDWRPFNNKSQALNYAHLLLKNLKVRH